MRADDRRLDWEGCRNVRDLGGLRTSDGRVTRVGRVVRSDALDGLTPAGWDALVAHGVRTVVDLRNDDEVGAGSRAPAGITTVRLPLDGIEDREFWDVWGTGPHFATPLYYGPHLGRFPHLSVRALNAVARAAPGAVVVHCAAGRDRTGLITMLLLALAGVTRDEIAEDYLLSAVHAAADDAAELDAFLAARGTTLRAVVLQTLADLDAAHVVRAAGMTEADIAALRARLLDR